MEPETLNQLRIAGDPDTVTFTNDEEVSQVLLRGDARVLLDKLVEFRNKEGSTHFNLSKFHILHVQGTDSGVEFSFSQTGQQPHLWFKLDRQNTEKAINKLQTLLS